MLLYVTVRWMVASLVVSYCVGVWNANDVLDCAYVCEAMHMVRLLVGNSSGKWQL